jgi:hypothetical protein
MIRGLKLPPLPENPIEEFGAPEADTANAYQNLAEVFREAQMKCDSIGEAFLRDIYRTSMALAMISAHEYFNSGFERGARWAEAQLRAQADSWAEGIKWLHRQDRKDCGVLMLADNLYIPLVERAEAESFLGMMERLKQQSCSAVAALEERRWPYSLAQATSVSES